MKPVKAIDLVFKAQPMIATLREIIKQNCDEGQMGKFIGDWYACRVDEEGAVLP